MLSLKDKLKAIECFSSAFKEQNIQLPTIGEFPDKFYVDRWILLDIYRVLQDHKKELINNASDQ